MTGVLFDCRVLVGFQDVDQAFLDSEEAAVAWALERVTAVVTQVTVEATAGQPSTFGIRHFKLEHGRVTDSGWSCWKDGDRVQTRTLDVLFAEAPGHPFFERTT